MKYCIVDGSFRDHEPGSDTDDVNLRAQCMDLNQAKDLCDSITEHGTDVIIIKSDDLSIVFDPQAQRNV